MKYYSFIDFIIDARDLLVIGVAMVCVYGFYIGVFG